MPLGLLDLSLVTYKLIDRLKDWQRDSALWAEDEDEHGNSKTPPFSIDFTGLAPDTIRNLKSGECDCHVSVYLFHVAVDKHHRNTFPLGGRAQTTPPQPLALDLYYLLTAYSQTSYIHEQQAMSVALKCFHENPIMSGTVPLDRREETFTLTIEPQSIDEVSRLWQAINTPMRLSAVYRVGVIFIEAPPPVVPQAVRHEPGFLDPAEVRVDATVPEIDGGMTTADATGLATVQIEGIQFDAGTVVKIRAQPLTFTNAAPLGGEFQVTAPDTLVLRLPLDTPKGRYTVTVVPAVDQPQITFELDVPERIVLVGLDATGLGTIVAYDAGFDGTTSVYLGAPPGNPLAPAGTPLGSAAIDPPGDGEFHVDPNFKEKLRLKLPASTPFGRQRVTILSASTLELNVEKMLVVNVDPLTGLGTIDIANAGFASGVTKVRVGAPARAFAETTSDPPGERQFRVVTPEQLLVGVGTVRGHYFVTIDRGSNPPLDLYLDVP